MRKNILIVIITCSLISTSFSINKKDNPNGKVKNIIFTENKGQVADQYNNARPDVLYVGTSGALNFHIKNNSISYQLCKVDRWKEVESENGSQLIADEQTVYRIDLNWLNTNPQFTKQTDEQISGYTNYYMEQCPNGALNVASYKGVWLKNIYSGINLHYYEKNGVLKYDYIVSPGVDYKNIKFQIEGAAIILQKDGSILLNTPLGNIVEEKPIAFQNGKEVDAEWKLEGKILSFKIEDYDPSYPLIIDPVIRVWGTYYGDSGDDDARSTTSNSGGDVFLAGTTSSATSSLIATSGGHQNTFGGGTKDAFLARFTSGGFRLWATYYGGTGIDDGESCTLDASGNIYLAGTTTTTNGAVMATSGSHQQVSSGSNAFLAKFNMSGVRQWSTYYGGTTGFTKGSSCSLDGFGNIFMSGITSHSAGTGIATAGAHQTTFGGGSADGYLVKFNSSGVRQWGTYYGSSEGALNFYCTSDNQGNSYLATSTDGTVSALVSNGCHQAVQGGSYDALIVKFDASGTRQWATFYGGPNEEYAHVCSVDASGNLFVTGNTTTFTGSAVATPGSHQPIAGGGFFDAYLVKFNSSGIRQWGTYYGGTVSEHVRGCITDASGNVYLAGYTSSTNGTVIATSGSHQEINGGGNFDAYLVKFNGGGSRLWGTYYGGQGDDRGNACSLDATGYIYLAGFTSSNSGTIIATNSGHQISNGGGISDGFLVRLKDCIVTNPVITTNTSVCVGEPINLNASISGTFSMNYSWVGPAAFSSTSQNAVIPNAQFTNAGNYTLNVSDGAGCIETVTVTVNVGACTSILENIGIDELQSLAVYPNPGKDIFTLSLKKEGELSIYNVSGQLVYRGNFQKGINTIDLSYLCDGLYFVRSQTSTIKLLKKN